MTSDDDVVVWCGVVVVVVVVVAQGGAGDATGELCGGLFLVYTTHRHTHTSSSGVYIIPGNIWNSIYMHLTAAAAVNVAIDENRRGAPKKAEKWEGC